MDDYTDNYYDLSSIEVKLIQGDIRRNHEKLLKEIKRNRGMGSGHYQRKPRNGNRFVRFYEDSDTR